LITPAEMDGVKAVYHLYVVRMKKALRNKLQDYLGTKGISTGIHYPIALPNLRAYTYLKHTGDDFPEATEASQEILSLPMYPELTEAQISHISKNLGDFFAKNKM